MTKDAIEFVGIVSESIDLLEKFNKLAEAMLEKYPANQVQKILDENKNDSLWIEAELRFEKIATAAREHLR